MNIYHSRFYEHRPPHLIFCVVLLLQACKGKKMQTHTRGTHRQPLINDSEMETTDIIASGD